jgi:hypothetical protein
MPATATTTAPPAACSNRPFHIALKKHQAPAIAGA